MKRGLVLAYLLLGALAFAEAPTTELRIALNAEFETLNPAVNSMMAAVYVQDAALRPLIALDISGKPKPILIKEIPSLKNKKAKLLSPGLKVEFEILPNASWGDGKPVICEDIKTAWEIGKSPMVSCPARDDYLNITDVTWAESSPKKCTVIFKEAAWNFYLNMPRPMPTHLEKKIFLEHQSEPQAYERNSLYVRDMTNPGLYNGAYRVSELKLGSHITLVPNEYFYGQAPHFKKVIFKFILNSASMEANLRSGSVNMTSSSGLNFDQAILFEKKVKADQLPYEVILTPATVYSHIDMNLSHEILSDIKVRKALAYSFNKQELIQAFFDGRQKQAFHFSTPMDSWYTENPKEISIYDYNKQKSVELLESAGWKMGQGGYRYKNGKKLSIIISSTADNKTTDMIEAYMQDSWKKIGVELLIKNYPARVFFSEIVKTRKFDLAFYSFISSPDNSERNVLHSRMIPSPENSWSGSNRTGWKNPQVDKWLDQVEYEFDAKKRISIMKKVLRAYTEELPAIPAYYKMNNTVIPKGLKNFRQSGHVHTEYLEIENWSM